MEWKDCNQARRDQALPPIEDYNVTTESKSLDELRAMARALGLRGYSKLRKDELIKLLKSHSSNSRAHRPATPSKGGTPRRVGRTPVVKAVKSPRRTAPPKAVAKPAYTGEASAAAEPQAQLLPQPAPASSEEERIETAKFAITPAGTVISPRALAEVLHEDIEQLPALTSSSLCLLPQKPGVLYAYWSLTAALPAPLAALRLRLCRRSFEGAIDILEEVALSSIAAGWYFHIPVDAEPGAYFVHLGHYTADGEFVTAIDHGIARIPSLYASTQTDRRWWISDADFRALYLRAGGIVRGARLGWPGGGVSSQR